MTSRATFLVVFTAFFSLAVPLIAQAPLRPTVARLEALKLDAVTGDVPAYYSKGANRDTVASLAQKLDACRSLYPEAGSPPVALAVLNAADWHIMRADPFLALLATEGAEVGVR